MDTMHSYTQKNGLRYVASGLRTSGSTEPVDEPLIWDCVHCNTLKYYPVCMWGLFNLLNVVRSNVSVHFPLSEARVHEALFPISKESLKFLDPDNPQTPNGPFLRFVVRKEPPLKRWLQFTVCVGRFKLSLPRNAPESPLNAVINSPSITSSSLPR